MLWSFISPKAHGQMDHAAAVLLPIAARAAGAGPSMQRFGDVTALATAGYSTLTDYPLGTARLIPLETHLALDAFGGAVLLASGVLSRRQPWTVRATLLGAGLMYLMGALCTRTRSKSPVQQRPGNLRPGETPMTHYAKATRPPAASHDHDGSHSGAQDQSAAALLQVFG